MACVLKYLVNHKYFSLHRVEAKEFPDFKTAFIWLFENSFPRTAFETEHVRFVDPEMLRVLGYSDNGEHSLMAAKKYAKTIGMINPKTGFAEPDFCYNKRDGYVPPPEVECEYKPRPPYDGPPAAWLMEHEGWKVAW